MSQSNSIASSPESKAVETFVSKCLTVEEAALVEKYVEEGKPGLAKSKAESLSNIYLLGYSCQDINRLFPEYSLPMLLYARVHYRWDAARNEYLSNMQKSVPQAALTTKLDSIKFVSEMLSATHLKWRKELMAYLAAPDREDPPKCLPNTIHAYKETLGILQELTQPNEKAKSTSVMEGGSGMPTSPLVSVNIRTDARTRADIEVSSTPVATEVKEAPKGERTAADIRKDRADAVRKRPRET